MSGTGTRLPEEDRAALRRFLQTVDQWLRLVGPERMAAENVFIRSARYSLFTHTDHSEMDRLIKRLRRYADWHPVFASRAAEFEALARAAEEAGASRTAGEHYVRAAGLYHAAQIGLTREDPRKAKASRRCVEAYQRGAGHLDPPVSRVSIPTSAGELPGHYRPPAGAGAPTGCVLLLNGANSVKEELHYYADLFVKRGLATVAIDGPGQGELSTLHGCPGLRVDVYERAVGEVLDWLEQHPELGGVPVALWGLSWGGFLALRVAGRDPRPAAVVSLGGFYDFRAIDRLGPWLLEEWTSLLGLPSFAATAEYIRSTCTLDGVIERIRCPYVVIHGELDDLLDTTEAKEMVEKARVPAELWVYEDGVHGCYNRALEVGPRMADWLAQALVEAAAAEAVR